MAPTPTEAREVHTRILRLALGMEESRAYWEHVDTAVPFPKRAIVAFEQRWFGAKSLDRVRFLLANFFQRYDAFPDGLAALQRWRSMDATACRVICHWHLQLSDPLYRRMTGAFLVQRRKLAAPAVDPEAILRWTKTETPNRWAEATYVQCARKLLAAASEAGLISKERGPRSLPLPSVPDVAIAYLLHLLRTTRIAGTLTDNPYLASVGLTAGVLDQRLRSIPGISVSRMADLTEFEWDAPTLRAWSEASL